MTPEKSPREELAELSADLGEWLVWAQDTGVTFVDATARPKVDPARTTPAHRTTKARGRRTLPTSRISRPAPAPAVSASGPGTTGESLGEIRVDLGDCQRCSLCGSRQNIVFGVGDERADVVVIGEAPGRNEDLTGEPFVGRAGQLLNRMLEAIGLSRDQVYIANVIKCRPPQNRDPTAGEIAACSPFLHRQLRAIKPKVILTVGRFAGQNIVGSEKSMGELRKEVRSMNGIPVVPTYHPAYLLRNPKMKRAAWDDLKKVRGLLNSEG